MYEKLSKLMAKAIHRWTANSPKAYRNITDIALGAGIAATVVTLIPVTYPAWVLPVTAFVISLSAKLTKE